MSDYNSYSKEWRNRRSSKTHFAHDYLEKPAMRKLLPDLVGKKILVLGCGSGEECFEFLEMCSSFVLGLDSSIELINIAKAQAEFKNYGSKQVNFVAQKIEELSLDVDGFDLVYSSLTMHYIEDWIVTLKNLAKYMKPEAKFLFSVHHPIKWGAETNRSKEENTFLLGYRKSKLNNLDYTIYGDYLTSRKINDKLFGRLDIEYYHKSISQIFSVIKESGMKIHNLIEPRPIEESRAIKIDFYETYSKIPLFLIIEVGL
jgi:SAM-dependent methyltransferase